MNIDDDETTCDILTNQEIVDLVLNKNQSVAEEEAVEDNEEKTICYNQQMKQIQNILKFFESRLRKFSFTFSKIRIISIIQKA